MRNQNSLFGPWEGWRKFALFGSIGLGLFLTFVGTVPLGISALLVFWVAIKLWKSPSDEVPLGDRNKQPYMPGTRAYDFANFFECSRMRFSEIANPVILLGFGPPREDNDHNILSESWMPPTRLSSWWALVASLPIGAIDFFINPFLLPAWGDFRLPGIIMSIVSIVGWFMIFQFIIEVGRRRAGADGAIEGVEPAPAVMLNKVLLMENSKGPLISSGVLAGFIMLFTMLLFLTIGQMVWLSIVLALLAFMVAALAWVSKSMVDPYRQEWEERKEDRDLFANAWMFKMEKAPTFLDTRQWPSEDEWYSKNPDKPYEPSLKITRCVFADSMLMRDYFGDEEKIMGSMSATQMVFAPIEERDANGRDIKGSVGPLGFTLMYTQDGKRYELEDIFKDETERVERDFIAREFILKPLRNMKSIGECALVSLAILTRPKRTLKDPQNSRSLMEIKIRPLDESVGINNFRDGKFIEAMKNILNVDYVRAHKEQGQSGNIISLMIGDSPYDKIEFRRPPSMVMRTIRDADFSHVFHVNGIYSAQGTPTLMDFAEINAVEEQQFSLPQGLSFEQVAKAKEIIMENTGNSFMEIKKGPSTALEQANKGRRRRRPGKEENENSLATTFSITSAKKNPLDRMFFFMEYKDQILKGRKKGEANLVWHPGVKSNDTLAKDDFDGDIPHLLIAGSSGSGKHLHVDTPIYTLNRGWVTMGEVNVGDVVHDMNGQPTNVIHAFDRISLTDFHRVTLSTGETITASPTHQWTVIPPHAPSMEPQSITMEPTTVPCGGFPHKGQGSAWFYNDEWHEATSWIDIGQMEESNPHVSSRIAQSAMRGIHPALWGVIFTLLTNDRVSPGSLTHPGVAPDEVVSLVEASGYQVVQGDNQWSIVGVDDLLAMAWEEDNTTIGLVHDVIDVLGWETDILVGASWTDSWDSPAMVELCSLMGVTQEDVGDRSAQYFDRVIADATKHHEGAQWYIKGLMDGMPSSGGHTIIWDSSIRYHLLTRGVIVPIIRSGGVELIPLDYSDTTQAHYEEYLRGYAAQTGIRVDDIHAQVPLHDNAIVAAHNTDYAMVKDGHIDVAMIMVGNCSADHLDVEFHEMFDEDGDRVVSVVDLVSAGHSIHDAVSVLSTMTPTSHARLPVMQKFTTGDKAKVSGEFDFYKVKDLGVGTHRPMVTYPTKDIPEGSTILSNPVESYGEEPPLGADVFGKFITGGDLWSHGYHKGLFGSWVKGSINLNKMLKWATAELFKDAPFATKRLLLSTIEGKSIPDEHIPHIKDIAHSIGVSSFDVVDGVVTITYGDVVIEGIECASGDEEFRCITVDSPSRTYKAGKTHVATHNSVVVQNMICQMIYNNHPNDLRMWFVEPKIGLQRFRYYDTCERFVDSWYPTEDFFDNVAHWAHDLVEEMLRRNRLMAHHVDPVTMQMPEKLKEARAVAEKEGITNPDGSTHELWIPFILAYIEECATVFADAADKEQKAIQSGILVDIARIAREARSAGIYLICLTQYPTNRAAFRARVIRNQMRRLGLACQNALASRICIEQDGLETLTIKGSGMIKGKGGIFEQFRGFLLRDGDPKEGQPNDILDSLADIPNSFKDGGAKPQGNDPNEQFIKATEVNKSIFNLWESIHGSKLDTAIAEERETKAGLTEEQADKMFGPAR